MLKYADNLKAVLDFEEQLLDYHVQLNIKRIEHDYNTISIPFLMTTYS